MGCKVRPRTMDADVIAEMQRDPYRVRELVRDGDVVLDVGGYVGAFALYVKTQYPRSRVISLEPMPGNFSALTENVRGEVKVEQMALVGRPRPVTVCDSGSDPSACHSIYRLGLEHAKPIEVPGETLEILLRRHGLERLQFLKPDCQGADFEILPSTPHKVLDRINYICMEVHRSIAKTAVLLLFPSTKARDGVCTHTCSRRISPSTVTSTGIACRSGHIAGWCRLRRSSYGG